MKNSPGILTTVQQFKLFINRIKPTDADHMLRIAALPAKKTPAEWWTNDVSRAKYYWNADRKQAWSRQWWLDWSGEKPALCDAKGEIKKYGYAEVFKYLSTYNRNGYGIYIQPNPCLLGDSGQSEALPGRCIFTESDGAAPANNAESASLTKTLAEQAQTLSPDLVVTTFKSAHTYRISESLYSSVGAWQVDQARFTQAAREVWGADTDESLTDANQLMRLPGFSHCRWQNDRMQFQPVQIVFDSGKQHQTIDTGLPALAAPIVSKCAGESHDFSPFELGSFVHLLQGYKKDGRKGFDTCKCPAHDGESLNSLHINQTTSQFTCHAHCDSKAVYQAALKIAIEKGYQLPARGAAKTEHWRYEENFAGVWGEVASSFADVVAFKDDAPDLLMLLPPKLRSKILASKSVSSPQAIALKAYTEFLERCGHPGYIADAKELIGSAWDWSGIPSMIPLWGWKGFLSNVNFYSSPQTKKALSACLGSVKQTAKDAKAAVIQALADQWEMIPEGVNWLDTQFFDNAIRDRVAAAGDERIVLGVYGATGTGKSYSLKRLREDARQQGRQFVYLTVKENLARTTGKFELDLEYRLDLENAEEQKQYPDLSGCVASLIENARGIDWTSQISKTAVVVLDEADLVLSVIAGVAADGNSLELQRVLGRVLQQAQTIVLMSAQLKSRHMELIERVSWCKNSERVGILMAAAPKHIVICDDTSAPDGETELEGDDREDVPTPPLKNWLIDMWAEHLRSGKTALTLSGSQLPDSKLGTMLLEQFALQECQVDSVLRLDSQSIKDPGNDGFKIAEKNYVEEMRANQLTRSYALTGN